MTLIGPQALLATFLIFCRVGTCLMLMPGFSSPRVPMRVRLFLAVSDPTNLHAIDEIKFATGLGIEAIVVEDNKL